MSQVLRRRSAYPSDYLGIGARMTAMMGSIVGGLFADCDALLAGAVQQIPPLVLAFEPVETRRAKAVRSERMVQLVLVMMGTVLVIRIIASASHRLDANRPDTPSILSLSLL